MILNIRDLNTDRNDHDYDFFHNQAARFDTKIHQPHTQLHEPKTKLHKPDTKVFPKPLAERSNYSNYRKEG